MRVSIREFPHNFAVGTCKDAYLVPMSIGYDKVIETPSYVKELFGAAKEKESISGLLQSTKILKFDFGRIDVRIGRAFSGKKYLTVFEQ